MIRDHDALLDEGIDRRIVRDLGFMLGAIAAVLFAPGLISSLTEPGTFPGWLSLATLAVQLAIPVAVLRGAGRWNRGIRPLVVATVAWFWLLPALRLLPSDWWPTWPGDGTDELSLTALLELAVLAATAAGPALVALALRSRRRTVATWPGPLVAAAALVALGLAAWDLRGELDYLSAMSAFVPVSSASYWLASLRSVVWPLWTLALAGLVWFAWSGVRAGEEPVRFWRLLSAGSGLCLAIWLVETFCNIVVSGAVSFAPGLLAGDLFSVATALEGVRQIGQPLTLLGYAAILAAFAFYLPGTYDEGGPAAQPATGPSASRGIV